MIFPARGDFFGGNGVEDGGRGLWSLVYGFLSLVYGLWSVCCFLRPSCIGQKEPPASDEAGGKIYEVLKIENLKL